MTSGYDNNIPPTMSALAMWCESVVATPANELAGIQAFATDCSPSLGMFIAELWSLSRFKLQ